jgi:hypothetical protein
MNILDPLFYRTLFYDFCPVISPREDPSRLELSHRQTRRVCGARAAVERKWDSDMPRRDGEPSDGRPAGAGGWASRERSQKCGNGAGEVAELWKQRTWRMRHCMAGKGQTILVVRVPHCCYCEVSRFGGRIREFGGSWNLKRIGMSLQEGIQSNTEFWYVCQGGAEFTISMWQPGEKLGDQGIRSMKQGNSEHLHNQGSRKVELPARYSRPGLVSELWNLVDCGKVLVYTSYWPNSAWISD